jgi:uncharacterized protein
MPAPDPKKAAKGTSTKVAKAAAKPAAAAGKAGVKKPAARPAAARVKAAKKAAATKAAAKPAAVKKATAARKPAARPAAKRSGTAAQAAKAAARPAAARRPKAAPRLEGAGRHDGPDPEGFFVARVRGEDAVREAPHQMLEPGGWEEEPPAPPLHDEGLGELPWTYGDDLLVALPRDPRTLFVYWDQARSTLDSVFGGLPGAKVQLWVFAGGDGGERVRVVDVALEARGWYIHDLEPGRAYRTELHAIGADGQDRLLPGPSIGAALPPQGPSDVIDDRFASLPWDVPLPKLMGPGVPGGPFSEEARSLLARLSGWDRFGHSRAGGGPTSPPGGPSSPAGPFSGGGR